MLYQESANDSPDANSEPVQEFNENETLLEPHHDSEAVHKVFMLCTVSGTVLGTVLAFFYLGEQPVFYSQAATMMIYLAGFSLGGLLGYVIGTIVDIALLGRFEG